MCSQWLSLANSYDKVGGLVIANFNGIQIENKINLYVSILSICIIFASKRAKAGCPPLLLSLALICVFSANLEVVTFFRAKFKVINFAYARFYLNFYFVLLAFESYDKKSTVNRLKF